MNRLEAFGELNDGFLLIAATNRNTWIEVKRWFLSLNIEFSWNFQVISLTIAGRYETQEIVFRTESVVNSTTQLASAVGASVPGAASQANVVNAVSNNVTELLTQVAAGASVNGIVAPSGASGGALGSASVLIQDVGGGNGVNQQQPVVAAAFRSPNVVAPGSQPIPYLPARSASGGAASSMPFSNGGLARSHYPFASMTHAAHTMLAGHPRIHPFIRPPARFLLLCGILSDFSRPAIDIHHYHSKKRKKEIIWWYGCSRFFFEDFTGIDARFFRISKKHRAGIKDSCDARRLAKNLEQFRRILPRIEPHILDNLRQPWHEISIFRKNTQANLKESADNSQESCPNRRESSRNDRRRTIAWRNLNYQDSRTGEPPIVSRMLR